ncbi:MAG: PaaI family thioesterase [Nitriliruptorales bacterium]
MTAETAPPPNTARLDALFRGDEYMGMIGAELVEWEGGRAVVRWTPRPEHCNFAGTVHGGAIFSLADAAFSIASNSWGRVCVALTVEIHYLRAPSLDVPLVAVGTERSRGRRSASYLIEVRPEADPSELTASFHAMVHRTGGWHFGDAAWPEDWRATQ